MLLTFLFTSRRCSRNRSPSRLPVSPMYNFGNECKLSSRWYWRRYKKSDQWSVILIDLLGSDIASTLWMKEQVLHREPKCSRNRHLKVPGWSLVWNELLTKKLPMFLSRLNEISEGCEKIVPVSASFWSNWKFLRIIDLTAWLWEKQDSHVYQKNSTSPLIFRKSQSHHYINCEKGMDARMDAKMNKTSNCVSL